METNRGSEGILSDELTERREAIVELLKTAYFMELETVMNYVTNSINPDGVRAQEVKENIEEDIQEELTHAQQFAERIKELYGVVPGSMDFKASRTNCSRPTTRSTSYTSSRASSTPKTAPSSTTRASSRRPKMSTPSRRI